MANVMESLLAQIERDNEARFKLPTSRKKAMFKAPKKGVAYTGGHHKSAVNPTTSKGSHKDGGHGPLDIVKNLGTDIKDTVTGIPGGVIQTVHDPLGTGKAIVADYKRRYSPLVHGDFDTFASEIAAHPLAPLLDVASVASGGGALAAKVGQSGKVARIIKDAEHANALRIEEKVAKATKPAKQKIAQLEKRKAKAETDLKFAESRVNEVPAGKVERATKPFEQKIAKLEKQKAVEVQGLEKARKLSTRPGSSMKTKAAHAERVASHEKIIGDIEKTIRSTKRDMRHAAREADTVALDVQQSSMKAFTHHENTIKAVQDEIAALTKKTARTEAAGQRLHNISGLEGLPKVLAKLQKATTPRYRKIGATKNAAVKEILVAQSGNPIKRLRQNLGIAAQESRLIPDNAPIIGLASRAKKAANLQRQNEAAIIRAPQRAVEQAAANLEKVGKKDKDLHSDLAVAAQAIIDGVDPKTYARIVRDTRSQGREIELSRRMGRDEATHHADTERLVAPHTSKRAQEIYEGVRQYFQREALRAGRDVNPIHLQRAPSKWIDSPEVKAVVDLQRAHERAANHAAEMLVKNRILKPDVPSQQAVLHVTLARQITGKKALSIEETNAMFDKAGLPRPAYNPDTLTVEGAKSMSSMRKESSGKLYARGTRINSPMNIVLRHELASKATDAKNAHMLMLSAATKIPAGKALPKGYVWIKDNIADSMDMKRDINLQQTQDGLPLREDFYRMMESEARPKGGYALPKHVHDDIARGRLAMTEARSAAVSRAMQVWKYMVLVRPAFLVHNVVSNQLMYHLKNGWASLGSWARASKALKSGVFDEHHFAEGATFGSTEKLARGKSKAGKAATRALNIFYEAVGRHEHYLRQLTMYETARKMPQVQRELRALKGGKYDPADHGGRTMFHEAYNRAVANNPSLKGLVSRNMDDTLGNYRYYTSQERMLKNISPFYGWERHSVRNFVRMVEDNPVTMAMLTQIGLVGHDKWNKDFGPDMPDFVHSYVQDSYIHALADKLGLEGVDMYDFNATNPWTTAVEVGEAAAGKKSAIVGLSGPLVTAPYETLSGKNALTGAPTESRFDNPLLASLDRVATSTPPVTTWNAFTSQKNEKKKMLPASNLQVGYQQGGLDFRKFNKDVGRKVAKNQRAQKDKYGHVVKKKKAPFVPYAKSS